MINKSVYLNRLVLQRAKCILLNSAPTLLGGKAHLNTHAYAQSLATKYSVFNKQLNATKMHTNAFLSQSATPSKTVLSDDLQSIMKKKIEAEDVTASTGSPSEDPNSGDNAKKGKFATMFSREHGWKVTLAFFGALMGGGAFYTLFAWGGPKLDENNSLQ